MKLFFKGLVSALVAFGILLTSTITAPSAHASIVTGMGSLTDQSAFSIEAKGGHNSITVNNALNERDYEKSESNPFMDGVVDGVMNGIGEIAATTATIAIVCYAANGLATTIFPPAIALAPACSALSGAFVAAKGGKEVVSHGIKAFAR